MIVFESVHLAGPNAGSLAGLTPMATDHSSELDPVQG